MKDRTSPGGFGICVDETRYRAASCTVDADASPPSHGSLKRGIFIVLQAVLLFGGLYSAFSAQKFYYICTVYMLKLSPSEVGHKNAISCRVLGTSYINLLAYTLQLLSSPGTREAAANSIHCA